MTRLTIDLRTYRNSGIGRYLRNLIPLVLPQLDTPHIRILIRRELLESPSPAWLADPRLEILETPAPVYSPLEQLFPFGPQLRDTTLLWVPHYNAPLLYRGRLAVTIHDLGPIALPESFSSDLKRRYARLLIEHAARHAAAILTVSQFSASELETRLSIPASRITVTRPGLDSSWPSRAEPHREADAVPYLLFVGNVKPNKNLSTLLTAFATVLDRIPHRLLLAGRMRGFGTGDDAVITQAETLGDRVRWTGEVSDAELISLYAGASALVMPSLYEGFGLPLLEAMQLGCPVISSNASSLPEVAGDAALFFQPRNPAALAAQLVRLTDLPLMQNLRQRGRERVNRFSYETCAAATAAALNPLLRAE